MKIKLKLMVLGNTLMLIGIYLRVIYIGYISNTFVEILWKWLPVIGIIALVFSFFWDDD